MTANTSLSLGGIVMIDKVEKEFGVFSSIFSDIGGRARDFEGCVKLHVYNRLTHSTSTHKILDSYSEEVARYCGLKGMPGERSFYRTLERIGRCYPLIMHRYREIIKEHGLADRNQLVDFSSTYFEGDHAELGEYGYSRDQRPDKLQVNFGIATGINGIPTALTIQKGNVQDRKHMRKILKIIPKVISPQSLLIFDAGANSARNKAKIRELDYNYLTLKPKKVGSYERCIAYFIENLRAGNVTHLEMNDRYYSCMKRTEEGETLYIFFSPELFETHIKNKEKKFDREKQKGNMLLKRRKPLTIPSDAGWIELIPHLQKTLEEIGNVYINGIEGFFILESSIDTDPEKILRLYKERDKAEKFIRALKEGIELRPIRHWNKWTIIGIIFVCFLTNFLINLTLLSKKDSLVKNVKILKKFLINLTLTIVYPPNGFKFTILSNVSPQILSIFGDFVRRFEDKSLQLRW